MRAETYVVVACILAGCCEDDAPAERPALADDWVTAGRYREWELGAAFSPDTERFATLDGNRYELRERTSVRGRDAEQAIFMVYDGRLMAIDLHLRGLDAAREAALSEWVSGACASFSAPIEPINPRSRRCYGIAEGAQISIDQITNSSDHSVHSMVTVRFTVPP